MNESLSNAFARAEAVRYSGDHPPASRDQSDAGTEQMRAHLLQDALLVHQSVTPGIAEVIRTVCERLLLPEKFVETVVQADAEIQASCFSMGRGGCVLQFASGLVELLSDDELCFVAGHEMGHWLFGHHSCRSATGDTGLDTHIASRAREISADRMGLLACRSFETAVQALMKTTSGLSNKHLRFDASNYLNQLRNLDAETIDRNPGHTHPSMLVRFRALLWFNLSGVLDTEPEGLSTNERASTDKRVKRDLDHFVDGTARRLLAEKRETFAMWTAAVHVVRDGRFDKSEQRVFTDLFGEECLHKMVQFLTAFGPGEVQAMVRERQEDAKKALISANNSEAASVLREVQTMVEERFRPATGD